MNPCVLVLHPLTLVIDKILELLFGIILEHGTQRIGSVALDRTLALHVGLASEDVDLHRWFSVERGCDEDGSR